ncbi:MAG: PAS domain-containing protein [Myxococcota bacterium]
MSDLEDQLRMLLEERGQLLEELQRLRDRVDAAPAKEVREASTGGTIRPPRRERPRKITRDFAQPKPPHLQSVRPRRKSDVVAIAPDSVPGIPRISPEELRSSMVEDRADFDAGQARHLDEHALDALPYGLVVVDGHGRVLYYNDTEARFVGLERTKVVGRNFFRDIAPCTRVQAFEGRFEEFVQRDNGYGVETFDFVFRFRHSVQSVTIYITAGRRRGTYNIAMIRRQVVRT